MADDINTIFETDCLRIRPIKMTHADLLYKLWKHPPVMTNLGFPDGLPITREDVEKQIEVQGIGNSILAARGEY